MGGIKYMIGFFNNDIRQKTVQNSDGTIIHRNDNNAWIFTKQFTERC